ncbi:CKLF-like MARVEL transmembrane domain-containing protein 3 isoform X1 [Xenopus laevis]|uniref:CKLF-like MARVEL transmembrane domain-containing protein 3 isoform X1 n=1 Tax=Xenopus laevis TaxID=8355 RepID=A0A8J0V5C2_XENLA|nr:CKLF-like MARVEL transmembrane domain-containing protein 3 isoform X1 [Xenopus laevis]
MFGHTHLGPWWLLTPGFPSVLRRDLSPSFCFSAETSSARAEVVSFLTFICYAASTAVGLMTVPLIEFLWALFTFYAYSLKYNEQLKGILWPLLDFIRCVSAAIIYFVVSLVAVSKYKCGASKAAAVFGFIATIIFAIDFYMIFNELTKFLKKGDSAEDPERQKSEDEESDSDSD